VGVGALPTAIAAMKRHGVKTICAETVHVEVVDGQDGEVLIWDSEEEKPEK